MQQADGDDAFKGRIGRTREESTPSWSLRPRATEGAPNIVIVYMDVGYKGRIHERTIEPGKRVAV